MRKNRNYKDTMFRMIFREKDTLLSLYNAVNGTHYTNAEELHITTLENAVYMNMKNDLSFVFDFALSIYEHQSTVNPNIPLRDLFYVSKVLQGLTKDEDLYGSKEIKIPTPRFIVFYNGNEKRPEKWTRKLSDLYEKTLEKPELELIVTVYNVNMGMNQQLLEACTTLKEYAEYVAAVRSYLEYLPVEEAVECAVTECIEKGILRDFLSQNRAEAIEMSIFEYNEEQHIKNEKKIAYEDGLHAGIEQGIERGMEIMILDNLEDGRTEEQIVCKLVKRFQINRETAEEYYRKALEKNK